MSKIDDWKEAKAKAQQTRQFANKVLEHRDGVRYEVDKFGITLKALETWYGVYGRSSICPWPDFIVSEFLQLVQDKARILLLEVADRLEYRAEKLREEAESEAYEVLQVVKREP